VSFFDSYDPSKSAQICEDQEPDDKDEYYLKESERAIEAAISAATAAGKTPEEIRSAIRRSYPFGALRKGKEYKIWNKLVHKKERELGLEPRRHKKQE
jgi:hypothetical protein